MQALAREFHHGLEQMPRSIERWFVAQVSQLVGDPVLPILLLAETVTLGRLGKVAPAVEQMKVPIPLLPEESGKDSRAAAAVYPDLDKIANHPVAQRASAF